MAKVPLPHHEQAAADKAALAIADKATLATADKAALATRDTAALADAYDAHAPRLFAVARRLLALQADAEECVQEVFVKLVERRGTLAGIQDVTAYLFASLRHAAAARSQHRRRQDALHARAAPAEEPRTSDPGPDQRRALETALRALPLEQREVIALKIDGDLTFAEIGGILGLSLNTAASRYRYALAKLKAALGEGEP
jgi:RNA polymerase sigma-70 factor (ECF subfamily)